MLDSIYKTKSPVFIVGSPRSGTTLLYHMLLSSGGFAIYRGETHIFSLLPPFFGDLKNFMNRDRLVKFWINSTFFRISTLDPQPWKRTAIQQCTSYSNLLELFMSSIALKQGVTRWSECTPAHLFHMKAIKEAIPDSKFIHIIRDGRDVAISMSKLGWTEPLPLIRLDEISTGALRWEWTINKGRKIGSQLGKDYMEVFFEDLINNTENELTALGHFIKHNLDYNRIKKEAIGSVKKPNTAFKEESKFKPQERWRLLEPEQIDCIEQLIGGTLERLGYQLVKYKREDKKGKVQYIKTLTKFYYDIRFQVKYHSPFGGYLGESPYQIDNKMS
jgi:hypothetical protein